MSNSYSGACFCGAVEVPCERAAQCHGLLSLPVLPVLVRGTGERVHPVVAGCGAGDEGRRVSRHLSQDGPEPSPVLPPLWWPFDEPASAIEHGRCVRSDNSRSGVRATGACQLCRDRPADTRRIAEAQRLPAEFGGSGGDGSRIDGWRGLQLSAGAGRQRSQEGRGHRPRGEARSPFSALRGDAGP